MAIQDSRFNETVKYRIKNMKDSQEGLETSDF
jgi:hypothetical protein